MNSVNRFKRFMEQVPPRTARAFYTFMGILVSLLIIQVLLANFTDLGTSHASSTIHINVSTKTSVSVSTPTLVPVVIPTNTPTSIPTPTPTVTVPGPASVPTPTARPQPIVPPTATSPPVQAPPPAAVTLRYSFEDGGTDGWGSDFTSSLQNSTELAKNGSHALKAVAVNPSSNPIVYINTWSQDQTPPMPVIGTTISAYVYIPTYAPDTQANIFVEDQNSQQFSASYSTLPKGTWVYLSYTVSSSISGGVVEYGVGFQLVGDNNQTVTAYIDSVNW